MSLAGDRLSNYIDRSAQKSLYRGEIFPSDQPVGSYDITQYSLLNVFCHCELLAKQSQRLWHLSIKSGTIWAIIFLSEQYCDITSYELFQRDRELHPKGIIAIDLVRWLPWLETKNNMSIPKS